MAGLFFWAVPELQDTGTTRKTLVQIEAAANHRVLVHEIAVSFQGVVVTDAPNEVSILRQSSAGTMDPLTLAKHDDGYDETLQTTGLQNASAEPTEGSGIITQFVHPQAGYTWQAPFGKELVVKGGTRLGVEVFAGVDYKALVRMFCEE